MILSFLSIHDQGAILCQYQRALDHRRAFEYICKAVEQTGAVKQVYGSLFS